MNGALATRPREHALPRLLSELPETEEAARWRADIEAEAARLDAIDIAT